MLVFDYKCIVFELFIYIFENQIYKMNILKHSIKML